MEPTHNKYLKLKLRIHADDGEPAQGIDAEFYDPATGAILLVDRFTIDGDSSGGLLHCTVRCLVELDIRSPFPIKGHD